MFKNYLKIAFRSLKKQAFFTFLNTFGLAIGMAGGLLVALYVYDELTFDTMFTDAHRIYRVDADIKFGGAEMHSAENAPPMAAVLKNDLPEVENAVRIRDVGSVLIKKSESTDNTKEEKVAYADASFFDMFGLTLLEGDAKSALEEPNTMVLSKATALKYFGTRKVVGETLVLNNKEVYTVTGIVEDLPKKSFLRTHKIFLAMAGNEASKEEIWGSLNYFTFIKLIPTAHESTIKKHLEGILDKYMLPWAQKYFPGMNKESFLASGNYVRYYTIPLTDIHLYSNRDTELSANSTIQNVYILSFIGLFLILLATVNFMNLSTAYSLKRAKEVGIRKTLGSNRGHLMVQFLTESGLVTFIAMLFAVAFAFFALPFFNSMAGREIIFPFTKPFFWIILVAMSLILGLLTGSYPAFFMSQFLPIKSLKGGSNTSEGGSKVRNTLVVFQFAISVFLIVSTLVVFKQLKFIQAKDVGFSKDQVLVVKDAYAAGDKLQTFKQKVANLGSVKSVAVSSFMPTPSARGNSSFFEQGSMAQEHAIQMQKWKVDEDYLQTLNMKLIAGRNFNAARISDSTAVIVNEATLANLGVSAEQALGKRITEDVDSENPVFYDVIGVVKNFHFKSLRENIEPLGLFMQPSRGSVAVKLEASNFTATIGAIQNIWQKVAPGQPFNYAFLDDEFNRTYEAEQRLGKIFITFTILSILIACLGLFGLAAFNAEKRTKEIGVRKVLGATVSQISYRLTVDFLKLVMVGILFSLPVAWFAMNRWLLDFSYRINIGWQVFVLAAAIALAVAIITVSYQSIKAALSNPVKSLKTE